MEFLCQCQQLGYCSIDKPTVNEVFDDADKKLVSRIVNSKNCIAAVIFRD